MKDQRRQMQPRINNEVASLVQDTILIYCFESLMCVRYDFYSQNYGNLYTTSKKKWEREDLKMKPNYLSDIFIWLRIWYFSHKCIFILPSSLLEFMRENAFKQYNYFQKLLEKQLQPWKKNNLRNTKALTIINTGGSGVGGWDE